MKKTKKNKRSAAKRTFTFVTTILNMVFSIFVAIVKSFTIDLVRNIITYFKMATDKDGQKQIHKVLEGKEKQALMNERLDRVERLTYAIYNDPSYGKREEGESDLKQLKKEIEK